MAGILDSFWGNDKKKKIDLGSDENLFSGFEKSNFEDVSFDKAPANALGQDLSGMGVSNNLTAGGVEGIGGSIPMTPAAQAQAGVADAKSGPDWKGMSKGLGEGMLAYQKSQQAIKPLAMVNQAQAAPIGQPMGVGMQANQMQPQVGTSSAMQAIMQGMPEEQRKMGILGMLGR